MNPPRPMRILMACAAFPPYMDGGGPISALMLARMLAGEGHVLRVVNAADEEGLERLDGFEVRRIRPTNVYWNYRRPRPTWKKAVWHLLENGNPRAFQVMRREIADFRPDVLLTDSIENINVASWAAARSLGVPVAHTLRSAFLLCWRGVMQKPDGRNCESQCTGCWLTSLGKRHFTRYVDAVCGESREVIERHVSAGYFPNALSARIPGAVDRVAGAAARPFPADRPLRVGFLSVHTPFKGLQVLGEAACAATGRPVDYVIAGTAPDGSEAPALTRAFPPERTRFLGWSDPAAFFPQVDLLVFPSLGREAFGRVAIEAFAHGVPVLGSDLGGIAETVADDHNGFLFPPGDVAALAALIDRVAGDGALYERLSRGALASAEPYYRPHVAAAYTRFLASAIDHAAARLERGREQVAS
ncbi:glycosyltransferase family 4 protein [Stappia sp. TSB10GB4]|uniref:glycosyltransferase family 4 protein n=1 Tax=Stappia sp. TSB10GB4 TaxID=2003584 RepID=UPI0016457AB5|nr:glycosyltransferase family 4 protein [Stappia sp. TSB10GB4]